MIDRRRFIATGISGLMLGGCDRLNNSSSFRGLLRSAEKLTMNTQRLLSPREALAREYGEADMSPVFRSNGTMMPGTSEYAQHLKENFANWRLAVDGLVARPLSIPLATLKSIPHRVQITRHDCVEGWSAIGKWHGLELSRILDAAGLSPRAKYIVFHCADRFGDKPYYESVDLIDAFHPQTIIAWGMNGHLLPVANGAPLRLRVERQIGYKSLKFLRRIVVTDKFDDLGRAGPIRNGWAWYNGI